VPSTPFDPQRCTLTVPNDLCYLGLIQHFVRDYVSQVGFSTADLDRFDLAVEEAVTNVIHGAFAADEQAEFDVSCERVPAGVQITVHDEGLPYDPSLTPDYDPDAGLDDQTCAGLGSFLIRQMADTVDFLNLGSRGKETVFVKYLEHGSVADAGPPAEPAPLEAPPPVPEPERVDLHLGHMRPEQAIDVCRCIYDAYRYTYVNEHMYYPDRVVALNRSGDMVSAVATTPDGEVAGHAALVFPEDTHDIADLATVAVKARYRGQSVARRLGEYLDQEARERGLAGIYVDQVTAHTFTQKFCHRLGFTDCGFLLAYSPATTSYKGINEKLDGRGSLVLGYKYLCPPAETPLYAPLCHRPMIAEIYERLGVPCSFAHPTLDAELPAAAAVAVGAAAATAPPDAAVSTDGAPADAAAAAAVGAAVEPAASELIASVNTRRSAAVVQVPVYGPDLELQVRRGLHRLKCEQVQVVVVYLNLLKPGTGAVADLLEDLGFLFTGILPGGPSGDRLVMQYFNGLVVNYEAMQVEDETARRLLEYIRANDPQDV